MICSSSAAKLIQLISKFSKLCQCSHFEPFGTGNESDRFCLYPATISLGGYHRQNTVELGRQHSRYGDIFYIEPNSQEAARIQEQLEKDEKDLPSYEEVMRMCNLTTPTAAAAAPSQPPMMETSAIGIAALPAPPYSEIDPHRSVAAPPPPIATVTTVNLSEPSPSTSRAAQITT
ncbi:PREDICTED: uncharacterized protein LOC108616406 isoform X6 [Drosophila arizonae]|uniref:Uncharacterized protein LOC108616406 isoform X6 n=1 Tax=Drosophila arizonae TaxID=7263 RepID=A0ABM1PIN1_DROAR|nr:PREDICTED: uncharacterized protein LOC108616406 isoform X6 [Drosophila arizonae]